MSLLEGVCELDGVCMYLEEYICTGGGVYVLGVLCVLEENVPRIREISPYTLAL